tara:strand:- start:446 stop:1345 length:900 start_codon:yes stop_codon:yes gene_type:complete
MNAAKFLVISGTHGNEINPIWAVKKFQNLFLADCKNCNLEFILGNPKAYEKKLRYIDVDLNRSFNIKKSEHNKYFYEIERSKFLVNQYGLKGINPFQVAIDLHTTTSNMGTSIVLYGRREKDFCLAGLLQSKFGLPIYLHEKDNNQVGFLVEAWPCGLVIEIGPVAQNHYDAQIVERFLIILRFLNNLIIDFKKGIIKLPQEISVFVHQKSIDYPRDDNLNISALIHPSRTNQDWKSIEAGQPLFLDTNGKTIDYEGKEKLFPVFIGEAAYREKRIAMSFTKRETIKCSKKWIDNFLYF